MIIERCHGQSVQFLRSSIKSCSVFIPAGNESCDSFSLIHGTHAPPWKKGRPFGSTGRLRGGTAVLLYSSNRASSEATSAGKRSARLLNSHGSAVTLNRHGALWRSQFVLALAGLGPHSTTTASPFGALRPSHCRTERRSLWNISGGATCDVLSAYPSGGYHPVHPGSSIPWTNFMSLTRMAELFPGSGSILCSISVRRDSLFCDSMFHMSMPSTSDGRRDMSKPATLSRVGSQSTTCIMCCDT